MMIIGLTGNIATGKSTVMALAVEQGAYGIDADRVVHDVYAADHALLAKLRLMFGDAIFYADGALNRPALGAIVFNDKQAMYQLEAVVHPAIRVELGRRLDAATSDIVMVEAIKLFESPIIMRCQQVWVTTCTAEQQIGRLVAHRGMTAEAAAQRVHAQAPQTEKLKRADVIIDTNGTIDDTAAQFKIAWAQLQTKISE